MSKPKKRLLLADDSATVQKVVNLTFADEGIEIVAVGDGDALMEKFVEATPDLVLIDVNMPGADGYKICEIIKHDEETAHIPVILLVGLHEEFDETEARRVGANDFLRKPFQSIRELVAKVSALLDPKNSSLNGAADFTGKPFSSGKTGAKISLQKSAPEANDKTIRPNRIELFPPIEPEKSTADSSVENSARVSNDTLLESSLKYKIDSSKTQFSIAEKSSDASALSEKSEIAARGENIDAAIAQPASVSPELIEQIAARVVAQLSERVIKELAREVVPQMSDLIAKELAQEKPENG